MLPNVLYADWQYWEVVPRPVHHWTDLVSLHLLEVDSTVALRHGHGLGHPGVHGPLWLVGLGAS